MDNSKVIWAEGMFLNPKLFQQQDRYHEARLHGMANAIHPFPWGVRAIRWDTDGLRNNSLRALGLSLIFQDGEPYDAPHADALPDAVDLSELPLSDDSSTFHVASPLLKNPSAGTSVRLIAQSDPRDSYVNFPVVRLRRVATGGFEVDPAFMPPSLTIGAAGGLHVQLGQLMQKLQAKVDSLYGHHREPSKNVIEIRTGDASSFWLLNTISASYANLMHYVAHPELHPERLFERLLVLAGGLMTYSKTYALKDLPDYDHGAPELGFAKLDMIIRELVDTVISSKYLSIALTETKPSFQAGKLDSGKINHETTLYLAVNADMPAIELVEAVGVRFKVGAPEDVDKCVLSALPGVKLIYVPQVPAAIPMRPNTYYFAIERVGPLYERMLKAQSISIYVPTGIRNLNVELVAVIA